MAKNKPVYEVQIWPVRVSVWKNETQQGTFYNSTPERTYKDGEEYKSSSSFGHDDLLKLAKCADLAHSWILKAEKQDRQAMSGNE